jgi:hypothetical protein
MTETVRSGYSLSLERAVSRRRVAAGALLVCGAMAEAGSPRQREVLLVLLLVAVLMAQQEEQCYCCKSMVVMLAPRVRSLRWRRSQKRRLLLLVLEMEAAL